MPQCVRLCICAQGREERPTVDLLFLFRVCLCGVGWWARGAAAECVLLLIRLCRKSRPHFGVLHLGAQAAMCGCTHIPCACVPHAICARVSHAARFVAMCSVHATSTGVGAGNPCLGSSIHWPLKPSVLRVCTLPALLSLVKAACVVFAIRTLTLIIRGKGQKARVGWLWAPHDGWLCFLIFCYCVSL